MSTTDSFYHEVLLEEAKSPQNKGRLEQADKTIHLHNASCGDELTVYLQFSPDGQTVTDVQWEGQGCVISQAAMSVVSNQIKGLTSEQIRDVTQSDLEQLLGLEDISVGRVKCLLLGLKGIQKGLTDD